MQSQTELCKVCSSALGMGLEKVFLIWMHGFCTHKLSGRYFTSITSLIVMITVATTSRPGAIGTRSAPEGSKLHQPYKIWLEFLVGRKLYSLLCTSADARENSCTTVMTIL